ncbi:MAG: polyphenol oxidase family protein, partial [Candidatus Kapabacteria bacterium]|nr:polyphenol oxidase family protein [Candidatus Kapabacteria bacterium]
HGVALKEIRADEKHPMNHTETPTDGLYTFDTNRLLCVSVADCCGVVLWNDDVMCAVHSGWKGTQQNIVSAMIDVVESRGISPRMLNVWLSPCATKRSYIVRSDVANYFPNHVQQVGDDQFLFDNHGAIREQVLERGVDSASITVCDECTMESYEYHSHRRDRDNAGRMAVFIGRSDGR